MKMGCRLKFAGLAGRAGFSVRSATNNVTTEQQIQSFRDAYAALRAEIGKVIVGHDAIVEGTLISLFAGGHVLLEGVPGLGKTVLGRTLSEVLDLSFNRIQF